MEFHVQAFREAHTPLNKRVANVMYPPEVLRLESGPSNAQSQRGIHTLSKGVHIVSPVLWIASSAWKISHEPPSKACDAQQSVQIPLCTSLRVGPVLKCEWRGWALGQGWCKVNTSNGFVGVFLGTRMALEVDTYRRRRRLVGWRPDGRACRTQ